MSADRILPILTLPSAPKAYSQADEAQARHAIEQHWHPKDGTGDAGDALANTTPQITLSVVLLTGNVPKATAVGNRVVVRVRFAGRTDRFPTAAEVRPQPSVAGPPFTDTFAAISDGETQYVSALGYDAAGNESALARASVTASGTPAAPAMPFQFLRRGVGLWQDSGRTTEATDGDRVYTWDDQASAHINGIANFAAQTPDDMRPLYEGVNGVRFGTGPSLVGGRTGIRLRDTDGLAELEVMVVVRAFADPAVSDLRAMLFGLANEGVNGTLYPDSTGHIQESLGRDGYLDCGNPATNLADTFHVLNVSASNVTKEKIVRLDNVEIARLSLAVGQSFTFNQDMGGPSGYGGAIGWDQSLFDGWVKEWVSFSGVTTAAQRDAWYDYLSGATEIAPIDSDAGLTLSAVHIGGDVIITADAPTATSVKIAGSTTGVPSDADVRATTAIEPPRPLQKTFATPAEGETLHVKAFAYFADNSESAPASTLDVPALAGTFGGSGGDGTTTVPVVVTDDAGNVISVTYTTINVGGFVPTNLLAGETFTVPANRQALFKLPIRVEGTLVVRGDLAEVS